jgi:hypothetical protein
MIEVIIILIVVFGAVLYYFTALKNNTSQGTLSPSSAVATPNSTQSIQSDPNTPTQSDPNTPTQSDPNTPTQSDPNTPTEITQAGSNTKSCLSSSIPGSSSTYYLVSGADNIISSGATVTYNPSNPGLITISNTGSAAGGQITIGTPCGDVNNITGTITLNQIDYQISINPGSLMYINQYAFNTDMHASNTPPPPSNVVQGDVSGYTRQGAAGDVQGFDITGGTAQSCAADCNSLDACMGFSIDSGNTLCNLKAAGYSGGTNKNQTRTVTYYSKDANTTTNRYFVLYNKNKNKWLTIVDGPDHHNDSPWYFFRSNLAVHLRDGNNSSKPLPGQSVWYYNPKNQQIVSALSPSWILSYDTNGNMSIQENNPSGMSNTLYYSTTKGGGSKQIMSLDDSKILACIDDNNVQMKPSVSGPLTQWDLVYLPSPTVTAALPTGYDWNVVFLLRTYDKVKNSQYGYFCAPHNAANGGLHNSASAPLTCIYDSDDPYNNKGAIWSCYGYHCGYATIYLRSDTTVCIQTESGGCDENKPINVIGSDHDCNQRGDCGWSGTGWNFTSDGYFSACSKYVKLDTNMNTFSLTSNKSSATKIVCIQINPSTLDLNNFKTNSPEIF